MTDMMVKEPRPGDFKHRESSQPKNLGVASSQGSSSGRGGGGLPLEVSIPSLPSLTRKDETRASSITPKQVESDIQFDFEEEAKVIKPGSFCVKMDKPIPSRDSMMSQVSPSQIFNKTVVLPNLTNKDLEHAGSIAPPKQVASDIELNLQPDGESSSSARPISFAHDDELNGGVGVGGNGGEGLFRPGRFSTSKSKDSTSRPSPQSSPSQVFNQKVMQVLPILSPRDEAKASAFVPKQVEGDIAFSLLVDAEEEAKYSKAAVEELEHSVHHNSSHNTNNHSVSTNATNGLDLDQANVIASFFGEPAEKNNNTNNEDDGVANKSSDSKEIFDPDVTADEDDEDFQVDESITKLEALLDTALDDEIAGMVGRDGGSKDSNEDDLQLQAQRRAELDAALEDMAAEEKRLGVSGGREEKPRESLMELEKAILDSAMSDDDFLESALSDDEFEISFFEAMEPTADENKASNPIITTKTNTTNGKKASPEKSSTVPKKTAAATGKQKPKPSARAIKPKPPRTTATRTPTTTASRSATTARPKPKPTPRPQRKPITRTSPKTAPRPTTTTTRATTSPKPKPVPKPVASRPRPKPVVVSKPKPVTSRTKPGPSSTPSKQPKSSTKSGSSMGTSQPRVSSTKPRSSMAPTSQPSEKTVELKKPTQEEDNGDAAPLRSPSPPKTGTSQPGPSSLDQSMGDFALAAQQQRLPPLSSAQTNTLHSEKPTPDKLFSSTSYSGMESSGRIGSYLSPRRSHKMQCRLKYQINLHDTRGPCELCYYHLSPEEKVDCDAKGYHIRVVMCRGGCDRDCQVFPRESGGDGGVVREDEEAPVRLCRTCFFNTHQDSYTPQKFEWKKRLIV